MKNIILTTFLCLPIVLSAQSTNAKNNQMMTNTHKFDTNKQQGFSKNRFSKEIPYIDTSNLKYTRFDLIVNNVNEDQKLLPTDEQVYLTTDLKLVKLFSVLPSCRTIFKIDPVMLKRMKR